MCYPPPKSPSCERDLFIGTISLNAQILLKSFRKEFENSTSRGTRYNDGRCVQMYGISFCFSFPPRAEECVTHPLNPPSCEGDLLIGTISLNAQILLKSFRYEFENSTSRGTKKERFESLLFSYFIPEQNRSACCASADLSACGYYLLCKFLSL